MANHWQHEHRAFFTRSGAAAPLSALTRILLLIGMFDADSEGNSDITFSLSRYREIMNETNSTARAAITEEGFHWFTSIPCYVILNIGSGIFAALVSEDSRPPRHCVELLDGSAGTSGRGSRQCLTGGKLAGRRCRCCPRSGARRLQRFPHALERRRPRHPHPKGSQGRIREAAVSGLELRGVEILLAL